MICTENSVCPFDPQVIRDLWAKIDDLRDRIETHSSNLAAYQQLSSILKDEVTALSGLLRNGTGIAARLVIVEKAITATEVERHQLRRATLQGRWTVIGVAVSWLLWWIGWCLTVFGPFAKGG